jgi:hypothetical protein
VAYRRMRFDEGNMAHKPTIRDNLTDGYVSIVSEGGFELEVA